jgi:transketolase
MRNNRFANPVIDSETLDKLSTVARRIRGDILTMTTLAQSGHPGGSLSSLEMYLILYYFANIRPENPDDPRRDKIVISHGHTSPGAYATLGRLGFFNIDHAIAHFRQAGSPYEGHVERHLPGIEWSTGNLGQGLSAGCGFALAARMHRYESRIFVMMGDGEQQKGQVSEARRFASKFKLTNLTALVDVNHLQLTGDTEKIMPQHIRENYISDGWNVLEVDGHDLAALYRAIRTATKNTHTPTCILAHTIMGKGVSFIENRYEYHGAALKQDQYEKAMEELGLEADIDRFRPIREKFVPGSESEPKRIPLPSVKIGTPVTYPPGTKTDNRSAYGKVIQDLAEANCTPNNEGIVIAVFDCDLSSSVKTVGFELKCPQGFFQSGIQEHNTATIAGAVSITGIITFFSDFGVFGVDETYNQERLNDINRTALKLVTTHVGIDVGEDGKTHQCIDYLALFSNLFHFKVLIPADPNQTDRIIRWSVDRDENIYIPMGRSKIPIITNSKGEAFFGDGYQFSYGKADWVREGNSACVITAGTVLYRAVAASDQLRAEGIDVGVLNLCTPKHPDVEAIKKAAETGVVITYEDHNPDTGIGGVVARVLAENGITTHLHRMGARKYSTSGAASDLFKLNKLDTEHVIQQIREMLKT